MSQPPTSKYPDMGEVTALRLELGRERDRANALEAALRKEVFGIVKTTIASALNGDLRTEADELKEQVNLWKTRSDNWQKMYSMLHQACIANGGLPPVTPALADDIKKQFDIL